MCSKSLKGMAIVKLYKNIKISEASAAPENRFLMEVNDLLPSRTRVLSSADGRAEPQIVTSPFDAVLDYTPAEQQQIVTLKNDNKLDEAFRLLFLKQCAALGDCLPRLFEQVDDYMPLLLALSFTDKDGVVCHLVNDIPESDWLEEDNKGGAVQIVGWLYQYYNTEPKEQVFANLKKNIKISAENIPAATQLFTPDWIVRYMVENSLGRLWSDGHPDFDKSEWKYYLDEAPQEPQVAQQLAELRKGYAALTPEDIKCIDPCMGSGHILAYLFDVLMQIYRSAGYTDRDAAASIVEHNLYGLDIDDRAAQMAYFVVMMKGCHYDSRFLRRHLNPHVYAIQESGELTADALGRLGKQEFTARALLDGFKNAKEYGSILQPKVTLAELDALQEQLREVDGASDMGSLTDQLVAGQIVNVLYPLIEQARMLVQKYDVVVTNPPYMGSSGMNARLSDYVKKVYPDSKSDLFAVFIERCAQMDKRGGYQAMITQHAWMFLSSFEKLRAKLQLIDTVNMAHLGARGFDEIGGEVVQTTSFVMRSSHTKGYKGTYCRLIDGDSEKAKADMFVSGQDRYVAEQDNFSKIPGSPVAYWVEKQVFTCFEQGIKFGQLANPRVGMQTSNNDKYLRLWHEVSYCEFVDTGSKKWIKYIKGGPFRRWYGNLDYVVWYNGTPSFILKQKNARVLPESELELLKCTWTDLSTYKYSCRMAPTDAFHDISGHCFYPRSIEEAYTLLAYSNTRVFQYFIDMINSSMHFQVGDVARVPVMPEIIETRHIRELAEANILLSKSDWDSFETSWDFKRHPLV